ncbi:MAG TPA: hemerythrin domain-containing protein [Pyrinomonadaceae bacterium]|nr:hemerythrin domain-containing protein [Pyrinomonadaceae bacterium]
MDAFELMMNDHQKVSEIFDRIESGDASLRREMFPRLKQEMDVHAHVEETIFYPALKEHAETRDLATHAYSEHNEVKQMLDELQAGLDGADDGAWGTKLKKLRQSVEHHVQEEEGNMFTRARAALGEEQLAQLGRRMTEAKQQQQAVMGTMKSMGANAGD